jgi:hypothetical protein
MDQRVAALVSICYIFSYSAQSDSAVTAAQQRDSTGLPFYMPVFSTSGDGGESDIDQQDISSLLQSSRDVFTQFAGYQFGAARYRMRGYTAENQVVMINGINVNNLESGFSSWSSWGGLNDVTRFTENRVGNEGNRYAFSGAGGYTNIDSRASSFKKGTRISYSNANKVYRNRVMLTHSTGMRNGWALTLSASSRYGNNVYIPGTYFNGRAFYVSIDRKINEKHLFSLTAFVAPVEQGRAKSSVAEAYELSGSHYYNSAWGSQAGKVRNATVSRSNRPMLMFSHQVQPSQKVKLTNTIYYNFGKTGYTGLYWYRAPNPRPDYYGYLPSYYYLKGDTANGDLQSSYWPENNQVNWDRLIAMNQANLYTPPSQTGLNVSQETRARYIVENQIEDLKNVGFNTTFNKRMNRLFVSAGYNANIYQNRKYKQVEDLLGADFWIDLDQFAENLGVEEFYQLNDIDNPGKKIYKGDRFGYDYSINIRRMESWSQLEYTTGKIDFYAGATISSSTIWREGYVANGKFPNNSKGTGEKINFVNYGLKGGLTYKITGRHFITGNGSYVTRPPEVNNMYVSPRVRMDLVSGTGNEVVRSIDLNYLIKYPTLKFKFTWYNTQINNQLWLRTYWHDDFNTNVNLIMKGVNENHQGMEIGFEKLIYTSHVLQGALGIGQFVYSNRPQLEAWQDNNSQQLYSDRTVYLKNYRIGGTPQTVAGLSYRYNAVRRWWAAIACNYFDQIYIDPNPDRRTEEATGKYIEDEKNLALRITRQQRLHSYYVLNLSAGKSMRIHKKYFANINLSVNNLLNNKNILVTGYEQLRWDQAQLAKFPPRYSYMTGLTYMVSANINF